MVRELEGDVSQNVPGEVSRDIQSETALVSFEVQEMGWYRLVADTSSSTAQHTTLQTGMAQRLVPTSQLLDKESSPWGIAVSIAAIVGLISASVALVTFARSMHPDKTTPGLSASDQDANAALSSPLDRSSPTFRPRES